MDTKSFLSNLKESAKLYKNSPDNSREFFHHIDEHYVDYINATSDERAKIRKFIKGDLFGSKEIAYALLIYVKERALQKLESTKEVVWLIRGLVAISMENQRTKFVDENYTGAYPHGDATLLLADLYVTAKENGIDPKPHFETIAELSDNKGLIPMRQLLEGKHLRKLIWERETEGKFIGLI
jgi:hypothetical protein